MKILIKILFALLAFIMVSCNSKLDESAKKMKETLSLEGIWQIIYYQDKDTTINELEKLPFVKYEGNTFVVSQLEKIIQKGIFKVELGKNFSKMEIKIISGINSDNQYKAIYKVFNDSLLIINYNKNFYPEDINKLSENGYIVRLEKIK